MLRKIFVAALLLMMGSSSSYAIEVTNGNSEGTGSLYSAINQANSGTDTIININHSSISTITLDRELTITSNVTINGSGITIEGTGNYRLFRITSGHAVFNGITFTNGNAASGNGGAIEIDNDNSWAEFNNCTFFGNSAQGYGGAVCVTRGSRDTMTQFRHCTIAGNEAVIDGGGIAAREGDMRIYSSIITGNASSCDIYALSANDAKASYNITGTSNFNLDDTNLTGMQASGIFITNSAGGLELRTINGVKVLELSGTSPARDAVPDNTSFTLSTDETGTTRPQLLAYDAGSYEALPVPVESFELYGMPYIQVTETGKISIDIYPENASLNTKDYPPDGIEWTSSNPLVLTIDSSGNAEAKGLGISSVTAKVHGWDASGNKIESTARALTIHTGEEPISALKAEIAHIPDETLTAGGYKLITPEVTLSVNGIELQGTRAGVNYILTAESSNTGIVETEIVSNDSIRLLAGDTEGSADVTVTASPVPERDTQAMSEHFTVNVRGSEVSSSYLGSSGGGCSSGFFAAAFMLVLAPLIHKRR